MKSVWQSMLSGSALSMASGGLIAADGPTTAPKAPESGAPVVVSGPCCAPVCCDSCCGGGDLQITVGERTWLNWGNSNWSFAGNSPTSGLPIDPISELKWKNLRSTVVELNIDAVLDNCWVARVDFGYGWINDGHIDDFDFNGDNRTDVFSLSRSKVSDDDIFYVNADVGYRIYCSSGCNPCAPTFTIDALVGYQYWRETYDAHALTQLVSLPPATLPAGFFFPGRVFHEVWERHSLRVGLRGNYQIGCDCSVSSRLMFVPWADHHMHDDHFDFAGNVNKTFENEGQGGFGVMWDATLNYKLSECCTVELGYQIWFLGVHGGTSSGTSLTAESVGNGPGAVVPLSELETLRHGALIGFNWRF